jgi:hypothetical protein
VVLLVGDQDARRWNELLCDEGREVLDCVPARLAGSRPAFVERTTPRASDEALDATFP